VDCKIILESLDIPNEYNIILGQAHFIKTVEDIYESIVCSVPQAEFGLAFSEASGPCLIRKDGTNHELEEIAVRNIAKIAAGHSFLIVLKNLFPLNILPAIKDCREVVHIFCATANPVQVILAESNQGRGILGVIDGFSPQGTEGEKEIKERKSFLRSIGYKKGVE